ncbi:MULTISPECIES: glycosyltransferase family 39 protein [unclassified Streptomyces]|uniref:glycosyltransferase family 39 protein n=1 Tax=unclassified Streptomyces TaxID=2593676 RepID=UPI0023658F6B|nr:MULTISPECIES: glycosyltransferase family 39 protein [unclassified Streptomyces]MDF3145570.1 glycosyltransferase family 39 protein [Streptomyces sp. T21Q-yed]WDF38557.1 glycosyltransferase family 39 protein [Streptomyces sp. T12]
MTANLSEERGTGGSRRLRRALPALVAAAFVLLHVFGYPATRFSNDSYRYTREAYEFLGDTPREATRKAVAAYCADTARLVHRNRMLDQLAFRDPGREAAYARRCERTYANGLEPTDPRYEKIFHTRPGYPLIAAPFVALIGAKAGLTLVALAFTTLTGYLVYLLLRALRAPPPTAVLGQVLAYVTPLASWGGRPLTEGPTLALLTALLLASVWLLQRRVPAGVTLFTGAFGLGLAVRYSSFLMAAPALAAAASAALFFVPRARHRGTWWLVGLSAGGTSVVLGLSRALKLPGISDSLQDTFTLHWTRPEIADPWSAVVRLNLQYWVQWLQNEALAPMLLFLLAVGAWGVWKRSVPVALCVIAVGATGFAATVAHPLAVELDRLYVPVWLIAVIGLPLAVTRFSAVRFAPVVPPVSPSAARAVSPPAAPPSP